MRKYFRQAGYFAAILILLPYVVTILLNGRSSLAQDNGTSPYVTVKSDEKNRKISLDEYGIGILAKEIEGDAEEEALKAQAVLIRTSIYKSIQDEGTSTVLTKEYWTRQQMESNWGADHYGEYYEKMKAAWDETRGQVLMYDGRLILTPYHRLSNGKTRSGNEVFGSEEYPYLQSRECPEDVEAKEEMKSPSKIVFTREESQIASSPRHDMAVTVRMGADKEGNIRAIDLYTLSNTGAYGEHGPTTVGLSVHKAIPLYGSLDAYRYRYDVVYTKLMAA